MNGLHKYCMMMMLLLAWNVVMFRADALLLHNILQYDDVVVGLDSQIVESPYLVIA